MEINLTMQDAMLHQKSAASRGRSPGHSSWKASAGKAYSCEGARFAVSVSFMKVIASAFFGGKPVVKLSSTSIGCDSRTGCKPIDSSRQSKPSLPLVLGRRRRSGILLADLLKARNIFASFNTALLKRDFVLSAIESLIKYKPFNGLKILVIDHTKSIQTDMSAMSDSYLDRDWYARNYIDYSGPVANNHWIAEKAIRSLMAELSRRLDLIGAYDKVSVEDYNSSSPAKLPYIVALVNEYSDFLDDDNRPVLEFILSEGHRAGIHLVLSTVGRMS